MACKNAKNTILLKHYLKHTTILSLFINKVSVNSLIQSITIILPVQWVDNAIQSTIPNEDE